MREIKFRGLTQDTNEWVFGSYVIRHGRHAIITQDIIKYDYQIIAESVGQYAGLKDKNDKEIYEGDALYGGVSHVDEIPIKSMIHVVQWTHKKTWSGMSDGNQVHHIGFNIDEYYIQLSECEIIGNIHEHGYLIE